MSDLDLPLAVRMMQDGYLMEIQDLREKNAKLRKLVRDMWNWLAPTAVGGGAPLKGLHNRMHELGVDFDG